MTDVITFHDLFHLWQQFGMIALGMAGAAAIIALVAVPILLAVAYLVEWGDGQ